MVDKGLALQSTLSCTGISVAFCLCHVLPSQQVTDALLALAWVLVPVYTSSGLCPTAPSLHGLGYGPCSLQGCHRCEALLWERSLPWDHPQRRGPGQGSDSSLFPMADCHHARVPPVKVWRGGDPDVPLWPVAPALHLHQDLCE